MNQQVEQAFAQSEQNRGPDVMISAEAYISHLERRFAAQLTATLRQNAELAASCDQLQADLTEAQSKIAAMEKVMAAQMTIPGMQE
jgi:uncharacterized protein YigA (DUF484 family)